MRLRISVVALVLASLVSSARAQDEAGVPPEVRESWTYLIGDWGVSGTVGGNEVTGTATFEWVAGKAAYLGRESWELGLGKDKVELAILGGWDGAAGQTIEQGFASPGGAGTIRFRPPSSDATNNTMEGRMDGADAAGNRFTGEMKVDRHGPTEFHLTTTINGMTIHDLKYVRRGEAAK